MHNWRNVGSNREPLLQTLTGQPFPVPARGVNLSSDALFDLLGKCTASRPAIVGWLWAGGGGHWTVCIGPTKDKSQLVILDPWEGVQYVQNDRVNYMSYQGGAGTLDLSDPMVTGEQ